MSENIVNSIRAELQRTNWHDESGPRKQVGDDTVIGEMSDYAKKLWTLHRRYEADIHRMFLEGNHILVAAHKHSSGKIPYGTWSVYLQRELPDDKDGVKRRCMQELIGEIEKLNLLMGVTMALLTAQTKIDNPKSIGQPMIEFRKGWQVVAPWDNDIESFVIPDHRMPNPLEHIRMEAYNPPPK